MLSSYIVMPEIFGTSIRASPQFGQCIRTPPFSLFKAVLHPRVGDFVAAVRG